MGCGCGSRSTQKRFEVAKDKTKAGSKAFKNHLIMQGIARAKSLVAAVDFNKGMSVFKKRIDKKETEKLIRAGKFDEVVQVMPWDKMEGDIDSINLHSEAAAISASEKALLPVKAPKKALQISTTNPRLRRFIDGQVGRLVVGIKEDARKSVAEAVRLGFDQGMSPRSVSGLVQQSVGITEKQTQRIMRSQLSEFARRDKLQRQLKELNTAGKGQSARALGIKSKLRTLTDSQIEARTLKKAANAQKNRALTIARTEMTSAVNEGQEIVMNQAVEDGLVDRDKVRKVWVTVADQDRSEICRDLDGVSLAMDEQFYVAQTGALVDRPPAHPNCRSSIIYETD